ncbi:MAG: hypothetical protein RRY34_05560 [Victivallaceae bacterium]
MNKFTLEFVPTVPKFFPRSQVAANEQLFSHRSERFAKLHFECRELLQNFTGGNQFQCAICCGSGSMANEIILYNYATQFTHPVVVINGEFGRRLYLQCLRANCRTTAVDLGFGQPFDSEKIAEATRSADLLLAVACETSCGMVNDISILAREQKPMLLDAVSAFGVDNSYFQYDNLLAASGSSGKALAGAPGLALVFFRDLPELSISVPSILELRSLVEAWQSPGGVRNTMNSNLLGLLHAGCAEIARIGGVPAYSQHLRGLKNNLIAGLQSCGTSALPCSGSPLITAFKRPADWAQRLTALEQANLKVYHQVSYLESNQLFEIATMGDFTIDDIQRLLTAYQLA